MIAKELILNVRITDAGRLITTVYDPAGRGQTTLYNEYSPDEHPEFNERLGNEIYSFVESWLSETESKVRGV